MNNTNSIATQEFQQVHGIISLHRSRALQTVNNENLLTAWEVGAYVMVALYDTYSSTEFLQYVEKLKLNQFVPQLVAQIEDEKIVQPATGQLGVDSIVQTPFGQIVQTAFAQFPIFLNINTLSNHFKILDACGTIEERIFYVLYAL